ncbi:MAG: UDP-3-O-(3-hydroxymyristoyl)glucosamine N-acyltransferase [Vicingaceae bacterium]
MKLNKTISLSELAALLDASSFGNSSVEITGINEIHRVEEGDIVFVDHPKYYEKALQSKASVVLINKEVAVPEGKGIVVCEDPFKSFNFVLHYFKPFEFFDDADRESVTIGKGSRIHPSAVIGKNVNIGENCLIYPNVVLHDNTIIGNRVIIQAGTVIGSNGFYYKNRQSHFDRLYSAGRVVIEDDVELGANCTIDRGVTAESRIGKGSKIDNLVQIGHDTVIGEKCLIAAHCGLAGCSTLGDRVTLWGQVGITSGVHIGDEAVLSAKSGVSKSLEGKKVYAGAPAIEFKEKYKEMAALRGLPDVLKKLKAHDG